MIFLLQLKLESIENSELELNLFNHSGYTPYIIDSKIDIYIYFFI